MGQGYHSKIIYGVILSREQTLIYMDLPEAQNTELWTELDKYNVSDSYDVTPVWFGIVLAATDEQVAERGKYLDISGGIAIDDIKDALHPTNVVEDMQKALKVLKKYNLRFSRTRLLLVTDFD